MNSTQYLIILITAVVCFCIYVLAEILRLRRREADLRGSSAGQGSAGVTKIDIYLNEQSARNWGADAGQAQRLTEEIRTRLEGGDGA